MKITFVNHTDLPGRVFNGYDLRLSLQAQGHECAMIVNEKRSADPGVLGLLQPRARRVHSLLTELESETGMTDLLFPYARAICASDAFQRADVAHYHMIHNRVLALDDWAWMLKKKPSVWTIHDPWILTGHCVHPLECDKWETGCHGCRRLCEDPFATPADKAAQMFAIKRRALRAVDPDVVVTTGYMKRRLQKSPITGHFTRVHTIPFGLDAAARRPLCKRQARDALQIEQDSYVIALRVSDAPMKGVPYLHDALMLLEPESPCVLLAAGKGALPRGLREKYRCIELGWLDGTDSVDGFFAAADVFVMPSLAESFGMMAVEAMNQQCPVVVFDGTVLPEITFAPQCGVSVPLRDSRALAGAIARLMKDPQQAQSRGRLGRALVERHYPYSAYVRAHLRLYEAIRERVKNGQMNG